MRFHIGLLLGTAVLLVGAGGRADAQPPREVQKRVTSHEPIVQPYLGFRGHVCYSVNGRRGMKVDSVEYGGPAWQMGLEKGDVIVRVNNWRVRCRRGYLRALRHSGPYVRLLIDDCRGRGLIWDGCYLPSAAPEPIPLPPGGDGR